MKISFCTIGFESAKSRKERVAERPLLEINPLLAEAGYDGVEIWGLHLMPLPEADREPVREQMRELGLATAQISPYFDFTASDAAAQLSIHQAKDVLEEARRLKARSIRVFTGWTASQKATEEQWKRCTGSLRELAKLSEADGILWSIETHRNTLADSIDSTLRLMREVNRQNVRIIFQPSTFGERYLEAMEALGRYTSHVHASNWVGEEKASLEEGTMDYARIIAGLRKYGFDGYISVEWMGGAAEEMARREAKYLKGLIGG